MDYKTTKKVGEMMAKFGELDWTELIKGKVVELRPEYNAKMRRHEREKKKMIGKDPLHQPAKDFKHLETEEASKLTGGRKGWWSKDKGVSEAGAHVRSHVKDDPSFHLEMDHAKAKHKQVLEGLRNQPKPKLASEMIKFDERGQWSVHKDEDKTIKICHDPDCKSEIKESGFIGNQHFGHKKIGLYNCPNCKTTVSGPAKEDKDE